ncbi:MAG: hypothetical protein KAX49_16770 [Halanaerobiales bacterium]|nr:hypothetical protein [Halanaerobiales bacterium]
MATHILTGHETFVLVEYLNQVKNLKLDEINQLIRDYLQECRLWITYGNEKIEPVESGS